MLQHYSELPEPQEFQWGVMAPWTDPTVPDIDCA